MRLSPRACSGRAGRPSKRSIRPILRTLIVMEDLFAGCAHTLVPDGWASVDVETEARRGFQELTEAPAALVALAPSRGLQLEVGLDRTAGMLRFRVTQIEGTTVLSPVDVRVQHFRIAFHPGAGAPAGRGLVVDLEQLLGRRVDVVTEKGLRERIRERVLWEAIPL